MHRPITPKDAESEEASSTPRAMSPPASGRSFSSGPAVSRTGSVSSPKTTLSKVPEVPTSPSTYSPRSSTSPNHGTPTPTQRLVSTWSMSTTSPTSPLAPSYTRRSPGREEVTFNRPETKMSTSSSSILPASTSSSSLASLVSPYLSESGTTPFTPDMPGPSTPSTSGDASPQVWTFSRKAAHQNGHGSGTIVASASTVPQLASNGSRPDTPLGQMYDEAPVTSVPEFSQNGHTNPTPTESRTTSPTADLPGTGGGHSPSPRPSHGRQDSTISLMELAAVIAEDTTLNSGAAARSPTPNGKKTRSSLAGPSSPRSFSSQGLRSPTPVSASRPGTAPLHAHSRSRSQSSDYFGSDLEHSAGGAHQAPRGMLHRAGSTRSPPPKPILVHNPSSSLASISQLSDTSTRQVQQAPKALVLQPHLSSSRSSIASEGSSFHSSDNDRDGSGLLTRILASKTELYKGGEDSPTESDNEDLLNCWAGISKGDLHVIHDKLVKQALDEHASMPRDASTQHSEGRNGSDIQNVVKTSKYQVRLVDTTKTKADRASTSV